MTFPAPAHSRFPRASFSTWPHQGSLGHLPQLPWCSQPWPGQPKGLRPPRGAARSPGARKGHHSPTSGCGAQDPRGVCGQPAPLPVSRPSRDWAARVSAVQRTLESDPPCTLNSESLSCPLPIAPDPLRCESLNSSSLFQFIFCFPSSPENGFLSIPLSRKVSALRCQQRLFSHRQRFPLDRRSAVRTQSRGSVLSQVWGSFTSQK